MEQVSWWMWVLVGFGIAEAIGDAVLAFRVYRVFKEQKLKPWPGAGWWMAWQSIRLLRNSRNRILNIHALVSLIPLGTAKHDDFRAVISKVRQMTDIGQKPVQVKVEEAKP